MILKEEVDALKATVERLRRTLAERTAERDLYRLQVTALHDAVNRDAKKLGELQLENRALKYRLSEAEKELGVYGREWGNG